MHKLFHKIVGGLVTTGASTVDYLIGIGKASWQSVTENSPRGG